MKGAMELSRIRRNREAGQALYLTAAALVVLMGFMGLGIDMGALRYEKRIQQTAADGGAIAAANELRYGTGISGITSAAVDAAKANGFGDTSTYCSSGCPSSGAVGYVKVTVNDPPLSGPHTGDNNCPELPNSSCYVEVLVSEVQRTYFMPVLGIESEDVTARAVATLISTVGGTNPGCMYTTGVGLDGDLTGKGTPTLYAPGCGITDDGGLTAKGSQVNITAGSIGVAFTNLDQINNKATISPTPVGITPVSDPLGYFPDPTTSGDCTTTYSSGLTITGNFTFAAGTTCILGDLKIAGNGTITGADTTIYVTGNVTNNGTSEIQLSAPDTGPYAGLVFWDPSPNITVDLTGTNNSYYQGAIYVPGSGSQLEFGGTNGSTFNTACSSTVTTNCEQYTIIVANYVWLHGTPTVELGDNYSSLPGGTTIIKDAKLVE
jgi:Flp pilus assembly protein TadG